jgi:hypothetical protein
MSTTMDLDTSPSPRPHVPRRGRRKAVNLVMTGMSGLFMAGTIAMLLWVLAYVAGQGPKYVVRNF